MLGCNHWYRETFDHGRSLQCQSSEFVLWVKQMLTAAGTLTRANLSCRCSTSLNVTINGEKAHNVVLIHLKKKMRSIWKEWSTSCHAVMGTYSVLWWQQWGCFITPPTCCRGFFPTWIISKDKQNKSQRLLSRGVRQYRIVLKESVIKICL